MATYTYKCENCGKFDFKQSMHDSNLKNCPTCNESVKKIFSAPNVTGRVPASVHKYDHNKSALWNSAQAT